MRLLLLPALLLICTQAMAENRTLARHFYCDTPERQFEIFFNETDPWNEPNTTEGVVAVKRKEPFVLTEERSLIMNVDMMANVNSEGVPCLITIKYSTLKAETTLLVNFCTKTHELREFMNNQEKVLKLSCRR